MSLISLHGFPVKFGFKENKEIGACNASGYSGEHEPDHHQLERSSHTRHTVTLGKRNFIGYMSTYVGLCRSIILPMPRPTRGWVDNYPMSATVKGPNMRSKETLYKTNDQLHSELCG